jgi:hypothetical protein
MKAKKILFYLLAFILGGCVPVMSLHPLYTKEKVVFDDRLLGSWVDDSDESTWQFNHYDKKEKAYELTFRDNEGKKGSFIAHLVQLKNELFLDVYPSERLWESLEPNEAYVYNSIFLLPLHTFMKIDQLEPTLQIRMMGTDEIKDMLEADPNLIRHEILEERDSQIVLTASTEELQRFMIEHANDENLFGEPSNMKRLQTKEPNEPNDIGPDEAGPKGTEPNEG